MRLENKIALITGAGSGIGRATALRFAEEGAVVGVADVSLESAEAVAAEVREAGGIAEPIAVDVSSRDQAAAAVGRMVSEFGRLDILINNAGINRDAFVHKMTDDHWDAVIDVNLKGAFLMAQAAMAVMGENGGGRIVSTASIAVRGNYGQANYAAAKSGIIGLTRSLALEGARKNITVNCISPGPTLTPMAQGVPEQIRETMIARVPLKRMADPSEIAAAHLFLASDDASFITGQHLFCDGGTSIGVIV